MNEVYDIFRYLKLPDEVINLIIFKHKGLEHPLSTIINNKLCMIYTIKPLLKLDSMTSYMWGLERSLNKLSLIKCSKCNKYLATIQYLENLKEYKRLFLKKTYQNDKFMYSYVFFLDKFIKENPDKLHYTCILERYKKNFIDNYIKNKTSIS